jgi:hypothetical protein
MNLVRNQRITIAGRVVMCLANRPPNVEVLTYFDILASAQELPS